MGITLWVDADACPNTLKEILYRAANRVKIPIILVANQYISLPKSEYISFVKVSAGFDVADHYIGDHMRPGDLVITADIPLASKVIQQKGFALNPRGTFYSDHNIREHLAMRNLMHELRDTGQISGGPLAFGKKEKQAFANALDQFLTKHCS